MMISSDEDRDSSDAGQAARCSRLPAPRVISPFGFVRVARGRQIGGA